MPRFRVVIKEMREVDTEIELDAADEVQAREKALSHEYFQQQIHICGEETITNHSREIDEIEEYKVS